MRRRTRRAILAGLGAAIATTGCLTTDDPGSAGNSPGPTSDTSPERDPETGTPTVVGITHGANEPRADHGVHVTNRSTAARDVRVVVTRESTGEVVFEETVDVAAEAEREVYNLERADPEGIEAFSVCGELADVSSDGACETIQTSQCYGDAVVAVADDGSLGVTYAVC